MFKTSLFALLLMCATVFGQDFSVPKQTIVGAEAPIELGEIVVLKASKLEKTEHLEKTEYKWVVVEPLYDFVNKKIVLKHKTNVMHAADGSVYFGAGIANKTLKIYLLATYTFAVHEKVGDKDVITKVEALSSILQADLKLGTGGGDDVVPVPPTPPGPTPTPTPPPLDNSERFDMAKLSYDNANSLVTDANLRAKGAAALAESFKGLESKIAAGALKTVPEVLKDAKESNGQKLKDAGATEAWSKWAGFYQDKFFSVYEAGGLKTVQDFRQFFKEISRGLSYVK